MKNLKLILQLFAIAFVVVIASSCRDEFTEKDAIDLQAQAEADAAQLNTDLSTQQQRELEILRDSLNRVGGIIHYTVAVVDAGNAVFSSGESRVKGTKAVSGAVVTASQNGVLASVTTGADGLAVFDDMRIGNIAVNIAVTDFTDVNFVADLTPKGTATSGTSSSSENTDLFNFTRNAATQVPVFPTAGPNTATISGRVTIETDLTNTTPEFPAAASVIAVIDVNNSDFIRTFIAPDGQNQDGTNSSSNVYGNEDFAGRIIRVSYDDASVSGAVDPATGDYSLTVPASAAGLPLALITSDVIADQTLYLDELNDATLNDVVTLRTIFGPGVREGYSNGEYYYNDYCYPSEFPDMLPAATVTFSAPAGATGTVITDVATGTAVLGMTGTIESINVTSSGKFSQAPFVQINGVGSGAAATASVSSMGEVTDITVDNAGQNYGPGAEFQDVSPADGFHDTPGETTVELVHSGDDAVVDVDLLASVWISDDVAAPEENRYPLAGDGDDWSVFPTPGFTNTGTGSGTGLAGAFFGTVSTNSSLTTGGSAYIAKYMVDPDGNEGDGINGSTGQEGRISGPEILVSDPDDVNYADVNPDDDFDGTDDRADGYTIVEGAITDITLSNEAATNNGSKYYIDPADPLTIPRILVAPDRGATATAAMSTTDGEVGFVSVTNGGTGYAFPPVAAIAGNATIRVADGGMGIEAIAFTNGNGYLFSDVGGSDVLFSGGGANVTFGLGTVVTGTYTGSALPTTSGNAYDVANPPVWTDASGNGTTDAIITGTVVDNGGGFGELTGFTITNAGAGYSGDAAFGLTSGLNPSGVTPIGTFSVATYTINNTGSYNTPPFILSVATPSNPAGAAVNIGTITLQVQTVEVVQGGSGYNYSSANAITFSSGGGSGATADALIFTSIDAVTVTAGGTYLTGSDALQVWVEGYSNASDAGYARSADTDGDGIDDFFGDIDHMAEMWVTGSIENVFITSGGYGYGVVPTFTPTDPTDPAAPGSGATFDVLLNDGNAYLQLTAGGAGYIVDDAYEFEVDVDDGTDAVGLSTLTNMNGDPPQFVDAILDINVVDGGSGFTAPPFVRVSDQDNEFGSIDYFEEFTTTLSGDAVATVDVVPANQRTGYTLYPDVEVTIIKMGASAIPNITASGVVAVNITNPGSGYDSSNPPDVIFVNDGTGGTGAVGTAVVTSDGRIESVTMTAPGAGYVSGPEVYFFLANTPYPAMGYVRTNEKGVVIAVVLEDGLDGITDGGGWGYKEPPTVTITSVVPAVNLGAGATAVAQIDGNGTVTGVTVTNGGADYFPVRNMPTRSVSNGTSQGSGFRMWPSGPWVYALPGKAEVREIRMGTGKREDDTSDCYQD